MFIQKLILKANRRQALASRRNGQVLHEVFYLLNAYKALTIGYNEEEINYVKGRLAELEVIANLQKEPFIQQMSSVYNIKKVDFQRFVLSLYSRLCDTALLMMGNMDLRLAIFCFSLANRIPWICQYIPIDARMMCYFSASKVYQMIPRAQAVMEQFAAAANGAAELGDEGYQYAFSGLILSAALAEMLQGSKVNVDKWVSTAWDRIRHLSNSLNVAPKEIADYLKGQLTESPENSIRIQFIDLAKGSIESFISYARGDMESAQREIAGLNGDDEVNKEDIAFVEYVGKNMAQYGNDEWNSDDTTGDSLTTRPEAFPDSPASSSRMDAYLFYLQKSDEYLNNGWEDLASSCIDRMERLANEAHSEYFMATCLLKRALVQHSLGNTDEAKSLLSGLIEETDPERSSNSDIGLSPIPYYQGRYLLATILLNSDPEESIRLLTQAYDCLSSDSDDLLLNRVDMLCKRSAAYASLGNTPNAEQDLMHAIQLIINDIRERIPYMEKMLRERFWKQLNDYLGNLLAYVGPSGSTELKKKAYELVLLSKGLLFNSEVSLREAVETEADERLKKVYQEIERRDISKRPKDMGELSGHFGEYADRLALQSELERVLRKYYEFIWISPDEITAAMTNNMLLIDYYEVSAGEDMSRYFIAFVIDGSSGDIDIVPLCPVPDVEKALDVPEQSLYNTIEPYGKILSGLILSPILSSYDVERTTILAFSPFGLLNRVAIENLPAFNSVTICDDYFSSIIRLSHASSLSAALKDVRPKDIVRFGGLNYGTNIRNSVQALRMAEKEVLTLARDCKSVLGGGNVKTIRDTDNDNENRGSVDAFKALSGQAPSILHIATHGFCLSKDEAKKTPPLKDYMSPMDLSGLYLSGAEEGLLHGTFDNHKGIVTASEISVLDFSATQLVILAACFSGDGHVLSDGIFGLQRAFKKAGAGRMILSLWDVDDEVVYYFQRNMYAYWMHGNIDTGPVDLRTAFKLAKEDVRLRYPDSQNWAGLIMLD